MGLFFSDYTTSFGQPSGQKRVFVGVAVAHALLFGLIAAIVPAEQLAELAQPFSARIIELAAQAPPPLPPKQPVKKERPAPLPLLTASTPSIETASTFVVAAAPPALIVPLPVAAPATVSVAAPVPVTAARFDADYLDNPKPIYPHASRRQSEEGRVLLRVRVSATGHVERVEIKQSSGFPRLDQAAEDAVARWRFVPARRGDEAIAAWVQVPITFNFQG
jgi:protein TonB